MSWQRVDDTGDAIIYVPHENSGRSARLERRLPSGSKLITDSDEGLAVRIEFRETFDWKTLAASGRDLTADEAEQRNSKGDPVVVLKYQDYYGANGFVIRSQLRFVEEYREGRMDRAQEFDVDVEVPEELRSATMTEVTFRKK